jgi:hypothetical protein
MKKKRFWPFIFYDCSRFAFVATEPLQPRGYHSADKEHDRFGRTALLYQRTAEVKTGVKQTAPLMDVVLEVPDEIEGQEAWRHGTEH